MPTSRNDVLKESAFETAADWSVSHGKRFRANIIIWGMRKHYSTLEVRTILADANFENFNPRRNVLGRRSFAHSTNSEC